MSDDQGTSLPSSTPSEPADSPHDAPSDSSQRYSVGTLNYTKRGLVMLFVWLLWGGFCFCLTQMVVPVILPLQLKELGSANWVIALIMSTLPGIFNTTVCPWVSFKSDSHRGKWGRRMPFIIYTMPFLSASMILIGLSDPLGSWFHSLWLSGSGISRSMVIVKLLVIFTTLYDFFKMFADSVFWYLFNDVVPEKFLGRFNSWFRMVAAGANAFFNYFILKHALTYTTEIYIGAALLYFFGFGLMCFMVKEGQYPPAPQTSQKPSIKRDFQMFIKECYSIPYYWNIFFQTMFIAISGTVGVFGLFYNQSLGLDLNLIGKLGAVSGILVTVCLLFAGFLVDRWHPVRVVAYLQAYGVSQSISCAMWLIINPPEQIYFFYMCLLMSIVGILSSAMQQAASLPREMILFPKNSFGAFCGAQALVRSVGTMFGGLLAGVYLDIVKGFYPPEDLFPYRYSAIWSSVFLLIAFCFHYRAFRFWKRLGGVSHYVPPTTKIRYADLPKAEDNKVVRGLLWVAIIPGLCSFIMSGYWFYYYYSMQQDSRSAWIYGLFSLVGFIMLLVYVRFVKFMERA